MTEAEWLQSSDPADALSRLRHRRKDRRPSERKLRLYCCACCRTIWHLVRPEFRHGLEASELFWDGLMDAGAFEAATPRGDRDFWDSADGWAVGFSLWRLSLAPESAALEVCNAVAWTNTRRKTIRRQLCALLRDIVGNPFRPATLTQSWLAWNDGTIPKLAQAIYDERELPSGHLDGGRLAILADALEDAGCSDANILSHCRAPGPHVRGCWVVDLLLGKE